MGKQKLRSFLTIRYPKRDILIWRRNRVVEEVEKNNKYFILNIINITV